MYSAPSLLAYCLPFVTSHKGLSTDAEDAWSCRGHLRGGESGHHTTSGEVKQDCRAMVACGYLGDDTDAHWVTKYST